MDPETQELLRDAEDAMNRLIEHCAKSGPVYRRCVKAAAHVSRTAKWLLNAVSALRAALTAPADQAPE